jgi:hypothetical protein
MNKKGNKLGTLLVLATGCFAIGGAFAGDGHKDQIAHARSAAPESVSANAAVMIDGEVAAEGSNGWTCMPEVFPGDGAAVCIDATWAAMMGALGAKEAFEASSFGMSYMLSGDPEGGGVSNSNPYHEDHASAEDYVETGPHLMIIVPKSLLEGMTDDPSEGVPWVMWGDTDYAHIMVPVE